MKKGGSAGAKTNKKEAKLSTTEVARWGVDLQDTIDHDDWSSAWQEVLEGKGVWGGRTRGGRGVQRVTGFTKDVVVEGITLSFSGKELLQRTSLRFVHGRRYGLMGENGVGKSTLLRRMAKQSIPGIPLHFRFGYVQQEIPVVEKITVLDYILRGGVTVDQLQDNLSALQEDETALEAALESEQDSEKLAQLAEDLCSLVEQIEDVEARIKALEEQPAQSTLSEGITRPYLESLGGHVLGVLDGLGLSRPLKRLAQPLSELSGGWRMRSALAHCLIHLKEIDVLLLDEPTNHLDLPTVAWLQDFLATQTLQPNLIVIVVSHDRTFLSAVCTDIVELKEQQLVYFAGDYPAFLQHQEEMAQRTAHALDARQRKEQHIQKSMDMAAARGDDRTVKAKQKKLERAAFTSSLDGHRYKLFSASKLDAKHIHMPDILDPNDYGPVKETERERVYRFKFPAVDILSLRLPTPTAPLMTFDQVFLSYPGREKDVLTQVTVQLTLQSRVGILGRNGRGKSTLMQALAHAPSGAVLPASTKSKRSTATVPVPCTTTTAAASAHAPVIVTKGTVWRHHQLRIGTVTQHQIDALSQYLDLSPMAYLQRVVLPSLRPRSDGTAGTETVLQRVEQLALGDSTAAPSSSSAEAAAAGQDGLDPRGKEAQELRALLGSCGISGALALQPIGALSGGQKARLSFAAVCASRPHILLLDEPSNHLSTDAIDALIHACQEFAGAVVVISHNRHLVAQICEELWTVEKEQVRVRRPRAASTVGNASSSGGAEGSSGPRIKTPEEQRDFEELLEACIAEQMRS